MRRKEYIRAGITIIIFLFIYSSIYPEIYHVKKDGDDHNDGTSWATALQTIYKAMQKADTGGEIWVAEGVYGGLQIHTGLCIYGGFQGSETSLNERDFLKYPTIIDGMESYSCLYNDSGLLDGFHLIRGGSETPIFNNGRINNCKIYQNIQTGGWYWYYEIRNWGLISNCDIFDNGNENSNNIFFIIKNSGIIANCKIFNNKISCIENEGGEINNCLIYNNPGFGVISSYMSTSISNTTIYGNNGPGIFVENNIKPEIVNCIVWNNQDADIICSDDSLMSFCCFGNATNNNGNISANPLFVNTSGDVSAWDFHLQEGSPCIDAGDPDPQYHDACLPPGKGTERNDMGAFGGQGNCGRSYHFPRLFLANLTEYGDVWGALDYGMPPFGAPERLAWLGFKFSPLENWYPLKGNANSNWNEDIIQITPYGDAWVAPVGEIFFDAPTRWGWLGFRYDEKDGYHGWYPLAGDVNGDKIDDLIQVTEYGDAWVALSTGLSYSTPSRWGWLGFEFSRAVPGENGAIPLVGDVNGDGRDDLIQITRYTDAWVARSAETRYETPRRWGWLGFKYAPYDGWYPMCGDMNGDGKDDLIQITPTGDPWVALSDGDEFTSLSRWGWIDFHYNEDLGYYPLLGDINVDRMADLIQINPQGEVWVSFSMENYFDYPEYWGALSFLFRRNEGYLPFFLGY